MSLNKLSKDVIIHKIIPFIQEPLIEEAKKWEKKYLCLFDDVQKHPSVTICEMCTKNDECRLATFACGRCDNTTCNNHLFLCKDCGDSYCCGCSATCYTCEYGRCIDCLTLCDECGDSKCSSCLSVCANCGGAFCGCPRSRLEDERCPDSTLCQDCAEVLKCVADGCDMTNIREQELSGIWIRRARDNGADCVRCCKKWICKTHWHRYFLKYSNRGMFNCEQCWEIRFGKSYVQL